MATSLCLFNEIAKVCPTARDLNHAPASEHLKLDPVENARRFRDEFDNYGS